MYRFIFLLSYFVTLIIVATYLISCGGTPYQEPKYEPAPSDYTTLKNKVDALLVTTGSLNAIINSDFSSCPASGDTSDALIRKICNVAQASTNEARIELKSELAVFSQSLQGQLDAVNVDLISHRADIDSIQLTIVTMQTDISTLQSQMTSANNAIAALQSLTASITGSLAGNLITVDIGKENVLAGPLYESVLRRNDKKRFNGYVQAFGTAASLGGAPLTAINGSNVITVTLTAHGFVIGDIVNFILLTGGRGLTSAQLYGDFRVNTTPTANTFTIQVSSNATSNGTLGGANGIIQEINGRGMSTLWNQGDVSDVAVRVSNLGSRRYNLIIRRIASDVSNQTAELCYDKTNNLATFATINAGAEGGSGNIACK